MIESPVIQILKARFGTVPPDVTKHLREILDEKKLRRLSLLAIECPDLETFRQALSRIH